MKHILPLLLLALSMSAAHAVEIAGVDLPAQVTLPGEKGVLVLNGAGIRKKFFVSVYLASLYLTAKDTDPQRILAQDEPKRVQMDMLYSRVDREKFIEGWNDGFAANQPAAALQPLRERLERFNAMFETLVEGDRVVLDYVPGSGTRVSIKDVDKGVIPGHDFNAALLKVWLGEAPVTAHLKKDLLGK